MPIRTALTALSATLLLALVPSAAQARTCTPPRYPGSGYFTSLKAYSVSCSTAKKVTLAHYNCRTSRGKRPKGRCSRTVLGYRCSERRTTIPTEIDARVTCRNGSKRVVYTYQQNL